MGKIFYIMGKSASGKDKIFHFLIENEKLQLKKLTLYTTRPIRFGEEEGKEYYFVNDDKLRKMQAAGKVIECRSYDTVHGIWSYFTADDGQLDLDHYNYLGIGTLESYEKLIGHYGEKHVDPIYIEVNDGERLARALRRESKQEKPGYQEMCRRFLADCEDFSEEKIKNAGITRRFENIILEDCIKEIEDYILSQNQQ